MKNISFSYEGIDKKTLQDISIGFSSNTAIGFVGKSGSGKTTLVDVVIGLLKPSSGHIEINDKKVNIFESSQWQRQIGYVSQDIYLLDDTIRNNIAFGQSDASVNSEHVLNAIKTAQLENFINSLPHGEETFIGDRGIRLSGGQKQRISIARAILRSAPIMVFDEATSSVDTETERAIQHNISRFTQGKTALIIAHRLSTIRHADRIIVLKNGTVVEEGHHDDLIKLDAHYADLWKIQTGQIT